LAKPIIYVTLTIQADPGSTLCNGITIHDNYGRLFKFIFLENTTVQLEISRTKLAQPKTL